MAERITITITTEGDAFSEMPSQETARILQKLACEFGVLGYPFSPKIIDINGNQCGYVNIEPYEE